MAIDAYPRPTIEYDLDSGILNRIIADGGHLALNGTVTHPEPALFQRYEENPDGTLEITYYAFS